MLCTRCRWHFHSLLSLRSAPRIFPMPLITHARRDWKCRASSPATIMRVIRIVTGKRCRELLDAAVCAKISLDDLIIAVRFDRTPAECMKELRRLADAKDAQKKSRDLTLDELHGMTEAVAWAKSTIIDINAWRAGEITWDAVSSAVALTGPPGTGKTTFAKVFAAEAGNLPLIVGYSREMAELGRGTSRPPSPCDAPGFRRRSRASCP